MGDSSASGNGGIDCVELACAPRGRSDAATERFCGADPWHTVRGRIGVILGYCQLLARETSPDRQLWLSSLESTARELLAEFAPCEPSPIGDSVAPQPAADAGSPLAEPEPARRVRVLLAEDDRHNQLLARHLLEREGCLVESANSGRLAIEAWEASVREGRPYDLILMDIDMPDTNGIEATAEIRQQQYEAGVARPIIALSAHSEVFEVGWLEMHRFDEGLMKPFSPGAFAELLARRLPAPEPPPISPEPSEHTLAEVFRELFGALQREDFAAVEAKAHSLWSHARTENRSAEAELAIRVEIAGHSHDRQRAASAAGQLQAMLHQPLASATAATPAPVAPRPQCLIVDDDPSCREFVAHFLRDWAECDKAADGYEAVGKFCDALFRGEPYDLVCLDIMMPDCDGHRVIQLIREIEEARGIYGSAGVKMVMTTACRESHHCIRAFREGCESYVTKPLDVQELAGTLADLGFSPLAG